MHSIISVPNGARIRNAKAPLNPALAKTFHHKIRQIIFTTSPISPNKNKKIKNGAINNSGLPAWHIFKTLSKITNYSSKAVFWTSTAQIYLRSQKSYKIPKISLHTQRKLTSQVASKNSRNINI